LNKILYQNFSKYSKLLRMTQNTIWQKSNFWGQGFGHTCGCAIHYVIKI
jgi:hypothetical protein